MRICLGFLYEDYKKNSYYWEIIKILLKIFLIVFYNVLEGLLIEKNLIALFLILFYLVFLFIKNPIMNNHI